MTKNIRINEIMNYLDKISKGLISVVRPEGTEDKYDYNEIKDAEELSSIGENFKLYYKKIANPSWYDIYFVLTSQYSSFVGDIPLQITTGPIGTPPVEEKRFEKFFPKKDEIDNFLKKWNDKTEGILSEIVKSHLKNQENLFEVRLWDTQPQYLVRFHSEEGRFYYSGDDLQGEAKIGGKTQKININGAEVFFNNLISLKYARGKISEEETKKELKEIIDKKLDDDLKYIKNNMKLKNISIVDNEITEFNADFYGIGFFLKKDYDKKIYYVEIPGFYENETEKISKFGVEVDEENNMTFLYGNPMLILKLGKELLEKGKIEI